MRVVRVALRLSALSPRPLAPTDGADGEEMQRKREDNAWILYAVTDDPSVNRPRAASLHLHATPSDASATGR